MSLTLISYNIHSGVGTDKRFDYARIGKFLAEQKADIVCLQEMDLRWPDCDKEKEIAKLKANYFSDFIPSPAVFTDSGWYGNAMLARIPHKSAHSIDISVANRQARNIQEVVFDIDGQQLRVLNTHQGLKRYERIYQFNQLEKRANELIASSNTPFVIAGDFNEWQFFPSSLKGLNAKLKAAKLGPTFPSALPIFKLDRFWYYPDELMQSAHVIKNQKTRVFSDHCPIHTRLNKLNIG